MSKEIDVLKTSIAILKEKNGVPTKIKFNGHEYVLLPAGSGKGKVKK